MVVEDEERERERFFRRENLPEGWRHGDQVIGPKIKEEV